MQITISHLEKNSFIKYIIQKKKKTLNKFKQKNEGIKKFNKKQKNQRRIAYKKTFTEYKIHKIQNIQYTIWRFYKYKMNNKQKLSLHNIYKTINLIAEKLCKLNKH